MSRNYRKRKYIFLISKHTYTARVTSSHSRAWRAVRSRITLVSNSALQSVQPRSTRGAGVPDTALGPRRARGTILATFALQSSRSETKQINCCTSPSGYMSISAWVRFFQCYENKPTHWQDILCFNRASAFYTSNNIANKYWRLTNKMHKWKSASSGDLINIKILFYQYRKSSVEIRLS